MCECVCVCEPGDEKVMKDTVAEMLQTADGCARAVGLLKMNKEQTLHV